MLGNYLILGAFIINIHYYKYFKKRKASGYQSQIALILKERLKKYKPYINDVVSYFNTLNSNIETSVLQIEIDLDLNNYEKLMIDYFNANSFYSEKKNEDNGFKEYIIKIETILNNNKSKIKEIYSFLNFKDREEFIVIKKQTIDNYSMRKNSHDPDINTFISELNIVLDEISIYLFNSYFNKHEKNIKALNSVSTLNTSYTYFSIKDKLK